MLPLSTIARNLKYFNAKTMIYRFTAAGKAVWQQVEKVVTRGCDWC
jgi:hypothetical protein